MSSKDEMLLPILRFMEVVCLNWVSGSEPKSTQVLAIRSILREVVSQADDNTPPTVINAVLRIILVFGNQEESIRSSILSDESIESLIQVVSVDSVPSNASSATILRKNDVEYLFSEQQQQSAVSRAELFKVICLFASKMSEPVVEWVLRFIYESGISIKKEQNLLWLSSLPRLDIKSLSEQLRDIIARTVDIMARSHEREVSVSAVKSQSAISPVAPKQSSKKRISNASGSPATKKVKA